MRPIAINTFKTSILQYFILIFYVNTFHVTSYIMYQASFTI